MTSFSGKRNVVGSLPTKLPKQGDFATLRMWLDKGLPIRAAVAATSAGCMSVQDIRIKGYSYFKALPNCGRHTLAALNAVADWTDAPKQRLRDQTAAVLIEELRRRGIDAAVPA